MIGCRVKIRDHIHLNVLVLSDEIGNQFLTQISIGSDEAHRDGHLDLNLLGSIDNALGNHVALHNSSEDIDKDALYFRMSRQNFKCNFHLFSARTATHIKEISRHTTFELNNVHGGHGETCSIHHAPNVTVESNVIKTEGGRLGLILVNVLTCVRFVVRCHDFLLSEVGVLVNVDFRVHTVDIEIEGVQGIIGNENWMNATQKRSAQETKERGVCPSI